MPATMIPSTPGATTLRVARPRLDALTGLRWLAAFWVFGYIIGGSRETLWGNLVWGTCIFAVALTLSAGLHYLVEKPAERRIRGWKDRRDLAVAS